MSPIDFTIVMQIRTGATRLPGKMTRAFWQGKTIPQLMLEELLRTFDADQIVVATTNAASDSDIEQLASDLGVRCFRGSEDDVLDRVLRATDVDSHEYIVRVCGDNPFLRGHHVRSLIEFAQLEGDCDYASFQRADGTPAILSHTGLFAEVIRRSRLTQIAALSSEPRHHEHMTSHILDYPESYQRRFLPMPEAVEAVESLRLTVDTEADFATAARLYAEAVAQFGQEFTVEQMLNVLHNDASLLTTMAREIEANQKT